MIVKMNNQKTNGNNETKQKIKKKSGKTINLSLLKEQNKEKKKKEE